MLPSSQLWKIIPRSGRVTEPLGFGPFGPQVFVGRLFWGSKNSKTESILEENMFFQVCWVAAFSFLSDLFLETSIESI